MACIDSRMLFTTVASQCQTLRELLAGDREYYTAVSAKLARLRRTPTLRMRMDMCTIMVISEDHLGDDEHFQCRWSNKSWCTGLTKA